jgi:hypothetical protein
LCQHTDFVPMACDGIMCAICRQPMVPVQDWNYKLVAIISDFVAILSDVVVAIISDFVAILSDFVAILSYCVAIFSDVVALLIVAFHRSSS